MSKLKKSYILVTGGAGFVGSHVVEKLIGQKKSVVVFDNLSFGKRKFVHKKSIFIKGDFRKTRDLKKLSQYQFHEVYHLGALHFIPYCNVHPKETLQVNVQGTKNILKTLQKSPPEKLFFASTAAVYGSRKKPHPERQVPAPMDIYGKSKLAGEGLVKAFSRKNKTQVTVGRLFNAYGPRETNPHLIPRILEQLKQKKQTIELGNLKPKRDYVEVEDLAECIVRVTQKNKKKLQVCNIGTGEEHSVETVLKILEGWLKKKITVVTRPTLKRKQDRLHLCANTEKLRRILPSKKMKSLKIGLKKLLHYEGFLK